MSVHWTIRGLRYYTNGVIDMIDRFIGDGRLTYSKYSVVANCSRHVYAAMHAGYHQFYALHDCKRVA